MRSEKGAAAREERDERRETAGERREKTEERREKREEITKKAARNPQMRPLQQQQLMKPGMTTATALRLIELNHSKRNTERDKGQTICQTARQDSREGREMRSHLVQA